MINESTKELKSLCSSRSRHKFKYVTNHLNYDFSLDDKDIVINMFLEKLDGSSVNTLSLNYKNYVIENETPFYLVCENDGEQ